jgi:hypothetical protein
MTLQQIFIVFRRHGELGCCSRVVSTFIKYLYLLLHVMMSRVAQSVQWVATDWKTGRSRFDRRQRRKDFSSNLCVQTGSGAHPSSCTMGTGGPFLGVKRGRGVTLTTHPHLVPRSRTSRSYTTLPPSAFMASSAKVFSYTRWRQDWDRCYQL